MSRFLPTWVWTGLLLVAWGGVCFYLGTEHANNTWLVRQAQQLQAAQQALAAEQARGDALTTALVRALDEIDHLKKEAHRAIKTATSGRACLGGAALRVLERAPGITVVPAPTGGAAAADGAAASAADDYATDTQTASWAIDAGAQYETCRAQLDALIDWHVEGKKP